MRSLLRHANRPTQRSRRSLFRLSILLVIVLVMESSAQLQWSRQSLTRGKLWETIWNSLQQGEPVAPGNPYFTLDYPGYSKGPRVSDALSYAEAVGFVIYGERGGTASAYTINTRFYASAQYTFALEEATLTKNYNFTNSAIPGEEIVTGGQHINELDADITFRSMVWSIPKYDDFVIHEITITNTGFTPLTEVYFGKRYGIRMTERSGSQYDEKYGWDNNAGIFYFYDHQRFNFFDESPISWSYGVGPQRGDIGDARDIAEPGSREHELDAPGYFTAVILDSAGASVYQNILEYLSQGTTSNSPPEDFMFRLGVDNPTRYKQVITHQQPRRSWDEARAAGSEGGNKYERRPEFLLSVGPLTIPAFGSVKVVIAEVMGEMDRKKIVEGGVANVDSLAVLSKAALLDNVQAARELYNRAYVPVAYPPPTPTDGENSLEITPELGSIRIQWPVIPTSYRDPSTNQYDVGGYRVYRSTYFTIGPWEMVADIPESSAVVQDQKVVFLDNGLEPGVGYYYCVTSYDTSGNESGRVNNNRFPIYPYRPPNDEFPNKVYVVPNPFRQHSRLLGTGERFRMEFIGLPSKCTITIYTLMGEVIRVIEHDDGSGSASWGSFARLDYQYNKWFLTVAPGIYLFRVESKAAPTSGASYIGKFAIVK